MKRYLVKIELAAKDNNPNYRGVKSEILYGKGEVMLAHTSNEERPRGLSHFNFVDVWGGECGYKTLSAALKGVNAHSNPEKYWDKKVTVVAVEL